MATTPQQLPGSPGTRVPAAPQERRRARGRPALFTPRSHSFPFDYAALAASAGRLVIQPSFMLFPVDTSTISP